MQERIHHLIQQLETIIEGSPWHGRSVRELVEEISWEDAMISIRGCHSAAQILSHMIAWRRYAIEHLSGNDHYDIEIGSAQDWPEAQIDSEEDWQALKSDLYQSNTTMISALRTKEDAWLDQLLPGREFDYAFMLRGVIDHDLYHSGQIGLLKGMV